MQRTLQTMRYLSRSFLGLTLIGFASMTAALLISSLILNFTRTYYPPQPQVILTSPADTSLLIFALVMGMVLFIINLKVALANGITRKTYLLASIPVAALTAAALVLFDGLIVRIYNLFAPAIMTFNLFYPNAPWSGVLLAQFASCFAMICLGWLFTMAYYRSGKWMRWVISLLPIVVYAVLKTVNDRLNGDVFQSIGHFWRSIMGVHVDAANPYLGAFSLLVIGLLLCALVYLLLRRAPLT